MIKLVIKISVLFIICLVAISHSLSAQTRNLHRRLYYILDKADSVILISHVSALPGKVEYFDSIYKKRLDSAMYSDWKKEAISFFNGQDINPKIIEESVILNHEGLQSLRKILKRKSQNENACLPQCHFAHHSILIYKGGVMSFLDISFRCKTVDSSTDIGIFTEHFDKLKFAELKAFFQINGLSHFWETF